MKNRLPRRFLISGLVFVFVVLSVFYLQNRLGPMLVEVLALTDSSLSGYAWSSNIGWISSGGNWSNPLTGASGKYGIKKAGTTLTGYAWSSNIGWISFESNTGTPPSGGSAGVTLSGNNLIGWARACSVFEPGTCSGPLNSAPGALGGWDGWIKMNSTGNPDDDVRLAGNQLRGFAWGADVIGWISFCPAADLPGDASGACVTVDTLPVTCLVDDSTPNIGQEITYTADASGPGLTYSWTYPADFNLTPPGVINEFQLKGSYSGLGSRTVSVDVSDSNGNQGSDSCVVIVENQNNPSLTVLVYGGDKGFVDVEPNPTTGSIDGCRVSDGSCTGTYTLTGPPTLVTLTADANLNTNDPPNDYKFSWIVDGVLDYCPPDQASCGIPMTGPKTVSVTFTDPTSLVINLVATPPLIEITSHFEGQRAQSTQTVITASNATRDVSLQIVSFTSLINGESIDQINLLAFGNNNRNDWVYCLIDGTPADPCVGRTVTIGPSHPSVNLSVIVPKKSIHIRDNSPYKIILRADGQSGSDIPVFFNYEVLDIRP